MSETLNPGRAAPVASEISLATYLQELEFLVNIDSGTTDIAGVTQMAEWMAGQYRTLGWHVEQADLGPAVGPGVMATNKPGAEHFDVLLVGHLDTVFPHGTAAVRPFTVEGDIARGPGVADMKSGLLSMLYALRHLEAETRERLAICVVLNPDEEVSSVHSHAWIGTYAKRSDCVLVFEGARADGSLVKARKGVGIYEIEVKGVAAHAGNDHQKGRSAVVELAHWILALSPLTDYAAGTTVNVGIVKGGTVSNVVPETAYAKVDIRFWKTSEFERVEQTLKALQQTPFTPDVRVELGRRSFKPAMELSAGSEALMAVVETAAAAVGEDIGWVAVGGGSDANYTSALGVPSLDGFGPIGGNYHGEKEFLRLDSVIPRIRMVQELLRRL